MTEQYASITQVADLLAVIQKARREAKAQAWEEGYEAGYNDGAAEQGMGWEPQNNQNPYDEGEDD